MNNFSLLKKLLIAFAVILFVASCDNEFSELNSDLIDGDIHTGQEQLFYNVNAYDRATGAVQTSALTTNFLGSYNDPVFGRTTANYVTQLEIASANLGQEFTENIVIDSVWLYVPYYSEVESSETTNDTTITTYSLNQVYGDSTAPFRLRLRRNNFYLRANDPSTGSSTAQMYYSDQGAELFDAQQTTSLLENGAASVDVPGFANTEIPRNATFLDDNDVPQPVTAETLAPGLFMYLDKTFFGTNIINPNAEPYLINNTVFKDYFRGISFYAEPIGSNSAMAALNFTSGYIKIKYTQDDFDSDGNPVLDTDGNRTRESLTFTLNMTGTHVNLVTTELNPTYSNALTNSDPVNGDNRLYLKGGEGSIALLDILSNGERQALKDMVENDTILINEANLVFYLDQEAMGNTKVVASEVNLDDNPAPYRIFLYDVNNKRPVYDYYTDGTTLSDTRFNRYMYGGIPFKDALGRTGYKIRITNHVSNLVKYYNNATASNDSTNVKLGLAVTNLIDVSSNARLKTPLTENWAGSTNPSVNTVNITTVPFANAMNPFGVVLYGPNIPVGDPNYDKRLRLEIFYTKPKQD